MESLYDSQKAGFQVVNNSLEQHCLWCSLTHCGHIPLLLQVNQPHETQEAIVRRSASLHAKTVYWIISSDTFVSKW
jgi:uncharacterized protein YbdZ (MbtH family)